MLIKILIVVAVIMVVLVVIVALQSKEYRVARSTTMSAPPLAVFAQISTAEFTFKPEGKQTAVTWSMSGDKNFMAKAIHLFMNMDKMIGGQFEKGLAEMKSIVEAAPKQ